MSWMEERIDALLPPNYIGRGFIGRPLPLGRGAMKLSLQIVLAFTSIFFVIGLQQAQAAPQSKGSKGCQCTFLFANGSSQTRTATCSSGVACTMQKNSEGDKYNPTCKCLSSGISGKLSLSAMCHTTRAFAMAAGQQSPPMRIDKACVAAKPAAPAS